MYQNGKVFKKLQANMLFMYCKKIKFDLSAWINEQI